MSLSPPKLWACCSCNILLNGFMQGLLVQLKQDDDEMSQLDALGQLNELLSISNEESLSMFPLDQLIPTLVGMHALTRHAPTSSPKPPPTHRRPLAAGHGI